MQAAKPISTWFEDDFMNSCLVFAVIAAMLAQEANATQGRPTEAAPAEVTAAEVTAAEVDSQFNFEATLKSHVSHLAEKIGERNLDRHKQLEEAADFIESEFKSYDYQPSRQTFQVNGLDCHNIDAEIKGAIHPKEIVIIGAHYDSVRGTPGANDNASGTAAMLTLAGGLQKLKPDRTLRFVAFTNEEPPYFQTADEMGSWVYAKRCRKRNEDIVAVLSLETMGFYTDQPNSQKYPPPLDRFYPSTGNFIGFIGNVPSAMLQRTVLKSFQKHSKVPSEGAALPGALKGVGWSDHWSFWQEGYVGIMITDTAPFRYPHYHLRSDTPDKINFPVFAKVVEGLVEPIKLLTKKDTLRRANAKNQENSRPSK